jgi:hypothetical protein
MSPQNAVTAAQPAAPAPPQSDPFLDDDSPSRADFLAALFNGCQGVIECRALPSKARAFFQQDDEAGMSTFLAANRSQNLYLGISTRRDDSSGRLENCRHLGSHFVDVDYRVTPEPEARQRLAQFPLPPSAVINSGGGLHVYWFLRTPLELPDAAKQAKGLLRRLAHALGADLSAAESARVLRVPGTVNYKYDPVRWVVLESLDGDRRYGVDELDKVLPPEPVGAASGPFTMPDVPVAEGEGRNTLLYRPARSLKARNLTPEAIRAAVEVENSTRCAPARRLPEARRPA